MALYHSTTKPQPAYVEVSRPDELDPPVPADDSPLVGVERRHNGQFATSEAATIAARRGGAVKARRVRLARSLGLQTLEQLPALAPYRRSASAFRQHHSKELARMAGGEVSAGPCSMIASASLQLAASRFLFEQAAQTGDPATFKIASGLANDSRQNLIAAYELATREAKARPQADPFARFLTPPTAPSNGSSGAAPPAAMAPQAPVAEAPTAPEGTAHD